MSEGTAPAAGEAAAVADEAARERLSYLRGSIDNLDAALVHLLAERFKCTQQVGELKARHSLPPADPAREAAQIERLRRLAEDAKLDPAFAEKFLNFIIGEVVRHHRAIADRTQEGTGSPQRAEPVRTTDEGGRCREGTAHPRRVRRPVSRHPGPVPELCAHHAVLVPAAGSARGPREARDACGGHAVASPRWPRRPRRVTLAIPDAGPSRGATLPTTVQ